MREFLFELVRFGLLQARACIFAASFFLILMASHWLPVGHLPRYDFICFAAVCMQTILLACKIETLHEVLVLSLFHLLGLLLELFKTHPAIGSWSYPEPGFLKIGWVPLYSGFMYAAVASYMCQAWRLLQLHLRNYPPYWLSFPLCLVIYANFFLHHFFVDLRWFLIICVILVFSRTQVEFTVKTKRRLMPLPFSFLLIGLFIWLAENISTYGGAWVYPDQLGAWRPVALTKITSWFLLVIISFIIVAYLKHVKAKQMIDRFSMAAFLGVSR